MHGMVGKKDMACMNCFLNGANIHGYFISKYPSITTTPNSTASA